MSVLQLLGLALGACFFISSVLIFSSWRRDNATLRDFGADVLAGRKIDGAAVEKLMGKVYQHEGFTKNDGYFLWRKLGATPVQILNKGGDCADKSRLSAAILGEYGIESTLVMLAPYAGGPFGHTVVEARAEDGPIVVDPVYDLTFPSTNGRFHDLRQLRGDPSILQSRLDELIESRGEKDKIARYRRGEDGAHYGYPKTINLDKGPVIRIVKTVMGWFTDEPELIRRPRFLEDPKLFLTMVAAGLAACCFAVVGLPAIV